MRASGRFDRPRSCRRAAGNGRVALGRATRAKDGFAVGCSWTGLMNATQSSVVRLADRLNAADAESVPDVAGLTAELGRNALAAALRLSLAGAEEKNAALRAMAASIRSAAAAILAANADDVAAAKAAGQTPAFLDRLALDEARLEAGAAAGGGVAALPDPVGRVLATLARPNGLTIERVATPLGVIGVIFESRPNVAADAGALCLKAGNAAILRSGSESFRTAQAIAAAIAQGLDASGLPSDAIQLVATRDRAAVGA